MEKHQTNFEELCEQYRILINENQSIMDYIEDDEIIIKNESVQNMYKEEDIYSRQMISTNLYFLSDKKNIKSLKIKLILKDQNIENFDNIFCNLSIGGSIIYTRKFYNGINIISKDFLILCPMLTKMEPRIIFSFDKNLSFKNIINNIDHFEFEFQCVKIKNNINNKILNYPWFFVYDEENNANIFKYYNDGTGGLDLTDYIPKDQLLEKFIYTK
jgi:hypothetical protein